MASKQFEQFYQTLITKVPKGDLTMAQIRIGFEKMMADYPAAPDIRKDPVSIGKLSAFWIHAPNASKDKAVLFFHGGSYSAGSTLSHQDMVGRISRASGAYVLGIDYRLAPEHPFPSGVEDAVYAYQWMLKEGFKPSQIALAGSSAGGGLAFALLLSLKQMKLPLPSCGVFISPWVDLALTGRTLKTNVGQDILLPQRLQSAAEIYLNGKDPKTPLASPLYADLSSLPPLLLHAGSRELLLDEIERIAAKAQEAKTPVTLDVFEGMFHCWHLFSAKIPEGQQAIDKIGEFIRSF